jgi:uncharacterized membrane protein
MRMRILGMILVSVAYMLGTHWLMTRAMHSPWSTAGVLAPMLVVVAVGTWRSKQRWLAAGAALLVMALCIQGLMGIQMPSQVLYLGQHVGINALLAFGFGGTLRAGHTAFITTMAAQVHEHLTPDMVAYTRKLTGVWTLYFIAMVLSSLGLFFFTSFETWALFANVLTPMTVVLMFTAEHLLRYRLHPEFERVSVADSIRSYMNRQNNRSSSTPNTPR